MAVRFRVRVRISGVREMQRAFRKLPKEASRSLRKRTLELSKDLAGEIQRAARASSPQSALVARTVRARSDRVPSIVAGGNTRVGKAKSYTPPSWGGMNRAPATKIIFGANFGATHLKQFRPHTAAGGDDYWFYSTIEDNQDEIDRQWNAVVDDVVEEFGRG